MEVGSTVAGVLVRLLQRRRLSMEFFPVIVLPEELPRYLIWGLYLSMKLDQELFQARELEAYPPQPMSDSQKRHSSAKHILRYLARAMPMPRRCNTQCRPELARQAVRTR